MAERNSEVPHGERITRLEERMNAHETMFSEFRGEMRSSMENFQGEVRRVAADLRENAETQRADVHQMALTVTEMKGVVEGVREEAHHNIGKVKGWFYRTLATASGTILLGAVGWYIQGALAG